MSATRTEPRVICGIANTEPGLINGVPFVRVEGTETLVSVGPIEAGTLAIFSAIPGYTVSEVEVPIETVKPSGKAAAPVNGPAGTETSIETKAHADGTVVTGKGLLPDLSPDEQTASAGTSAAATAGAGASTESGAGEGAGGAGQAADTANAGAGGGAAANADDPELAAARALLAGSAGKPKAAAKTTAKAKAVAAK